MREQYPRAALFGTEERTLFSTIRGREYHLSIALPDRYTTSVTEVFAQRCDFMST